MTTVELTPRLEALRSELPADSEQAARAEPSFPRATSLLFNSGNVVQSDRLKKRTNLNPQEELNEVLNNTLFSWLNSEERALNQEQKSVKCRHPDLHERLAESEVNDISISGDQN